MDASHNVIQALVGVDSVPNPALNPDDSSDDNGNYVEEH